MVSFHRIWALQAFNHDSDAGHPPIDIGLPFSFVYDGRPSAELLKGWEARAEDDKVNAAVLRRTLTFNDPLTGLEVRAVVHIYLDTPGVDWTVYFTNRGSEDTPFLEQVRAVDVAVTPGPGGTPVLHRLHGSGCAVDDWLPYDEMLPAGQRITMAPVGGKSSQGVSPFFNLQWDGGGLITAIGWTGQWEAAVEHGKDGHLRIQAGQQTLRARLHPGETIRSPRILQLYWSGNDEARAYNLFRHTMFAHIMPRVEGKPVHAPITQLISCLEGNGISEASVMAHMEPIKGLGFEVYWVDAFWTRGGFPEGMGNYGFPIERAVALDRFPRGLRPIADAARKEGMGFLVWFEPERVAQNTELTREHPEWVVPPKNAEGFGQFSGLFNLGIPEAREFMTRYLCEAIKEYGMDCLRIDFNFNPLPHWQHLDEQDPERAGVGENHYVTGLYQMWDDILAAYPHLYIDNCASGGMRIDLETCARSIPLWRTDATIAPMVRHDFDQVSLQNQVMTAGLSRYVPYNTSGNSGAKPYWFRSGFNSGISFYEDCQPADYPLALLKQGIAEGKRIRKYYGGDFYVLGDVTTSARDWCVWQYHLTAEHGGMVMAFRRHRSPYTTFACHLREIDPQAEYEVTLAYGYEPSAPQTINGAELAQQVLQIADCPGSVILEYRRANR